MVGLRLRLLGGLEARLASGALLDLPTKKAQALLAYLGTRPGQAHPRDRLAALLWSETSDRQARDNLRHALAALRRALVVPEPHPPVLRVAGQSLSIAPDQVEVDVVSFERLVAQGTPDAMEEAAVMYRGDLLLGFSLNEPLFEDWLVAERERLREVALEVLAKLLAHQARSAATERAIRTAAQLLTLDPLQEPVHRMLMQLYARQGRRGAALKQYQLCVDALRRELGTAPEKETKALYQELLRRSVGVPGGVDAGEGGVAQPPAGRERRSPAEAAGEPPSLDLPALQTPLFGRQAELGALEARVQDAIRGRGHVATVVGETGIGKTGLVGALAAAALAQGCRVLMGRCHESDAVLPFAPWVDACRGGRVAADAEVLEALHPTRRAELARLLPEAGRPGLPAPGESLLPLFESVADLLAHAAARQPLVLVLEDMHWADEMSLRLLAFVGRRVPAWPALLIVTARDEDLPTGGLAQRTLGELAHATPATHVRLAPLSRADVARIVRALARVGSDAAALAGLEEGIWVMSEGNPLVAVEAMRAVAAGGGRDGGREGPGELSLPERVRELIAGRLEQLGADSQALVAVAAVIGRRFDFALLHSASGMDERRAAAAVEDMVRNHVLRTVGNLLEFTHDRVRDVAYGRLVPPRRRLLHAAVADALEQAPVAERPGEHIEQLVHHALRGDLPERAVHYLRLAGDWAAARSAPGNARTAFEQALGMLRALPETRATLEQAFDVRLALRPVLLQLGELRHVLDLLREAEALAERLADERRLGQVCAFLTNIHARLDQPDAALSTGARALAVALRLNDPRLRILATTYIGQAHYYRGEYTRVIELATANLAALRPEWVHEFLGGSQPPAVNDRFRLIASLAHLGRFAEAAAHEPEVIHLAMATRHAYTLAVAYHAAATLHLVKGDWAEAGAVTARQVAVLREGNIGGELPNALASSARALAHLGETSEAQDRCREAERLLEQHSARGSAGAGWICCSLGRAWLVLGDPDEAQRLAALALESRSARTDFVPDTLLLLGDCAARPDRPDATRAETHYAEALALAELRGMRPLVAHCHLGRGRLCARTDRRDQAVEHLRAAAAMYREMEMGGWLAQAVEDLRRLA